MYDENLLGHWFYASNNYMECKHVQSFQDGCHVLWIEKTPRFVSNSLTPSTDGHSCPYWHVYSAALMQQSAAFETEVSKRIFLFEWSLPFCHKKGWELLAKRKIYFFILTMKGSVPGTSCTRYLLWIGYILCIRAKQPSITILDHTGPGCTPIAIEVLNGGSKFVGSGVCCAPPNTRPFSVNPILTMPLVTH